MNAHVSILKTYMSALGRSDYATIKGLFAPGGLVRSPFLEVMDLLGFDLETNQGLTLDLIYDTHPIRSTAGNKYES